MRTVPGTPVDSTRQALTVAPCSRNWELAGVAQPGHKAAQPFHGRFNLLQRGGEAAAQESFTAGAESAAWDASDLFLLEQADGEVL